MGDLEYLRFLLSSPLIGDDEAAVLAERIVPDQVVVTEEAESLSLDMLLAERRHVRV